GTDNPAHPGAQPVPPPVREAGPGGRGKAPPGSGHRAGRRGADAHSPPPRGRPRGQPRVSPGLTAWAAPYEPVCGLAGGLDGPGRTSVLLTVEAPKARKRLLRRAAGRDLPAAWVPCPPGEQVRPGLPRPAQRGTDFGSVFSRVKAKNGRAAFPFLR